VPFVVLAAGRQSNIGSNPGAVAIEVQAFEFLPEIAIA
jgi:hypothetical protein